MDKNKIKSYAVWARRAMIEAVKDRAFKVGIEENKIHDIERLQGGFKVVGREEIFNIPSTHRDTLVKLINEKGYEQVIEEVAYTWFNRFMGLRFMEVNEYLPTGVRILSSEDEGKTEPDVLTKINDIEDELDLNLDYVYELQDKGTEQAREELYKYILIKQCNELGNIIPQMFEKIQDYTELLLPDNLLQEGSVIRKMVTDIDEEDWKEEVEIIGWMYQYYISEKKKQVDINVESGLKVKKEELPAKTQLFTTNWIVKYMVENSLGRLWIESHPNEELQKKWKYYLEEAQQEPKVEEALKKIREEHRYLVPEDIKILDPCMGSGHILVYAFDVLYQIYIEAGYGEREIPRKILQNNLYGLDIDDRASQLASFALIMKARQYNRRLFREIEKEELELNLCSIQESNVITKEAIEYFTGDSEELRENIEYLVEIFRDAKEFGAILRFNYIKLDNIKKRLTKIKNIEVNDVFENYNKLLTLSIFPKLIKQVEIMQERYYITITNPPYLGRTGMNSNLKEYLKNKYPDSKADLFGTMIEVCKSRTLKEGFFSLVTSDSLMFISNYEKLRNTLIDDTIIYNMVHIGGKGFEEVGVKTTSFVIRNYRLDGFIGNYVRLGEVNNFEEKKDELLKITLFKEKDTIKCNQKSFKDIPGNPFGYWISDNLLQAFKTGNLIGKKYNPRAGISTGNNDLFLRLWYEVSNDNIGFNINSYDKYINSNFKWYLYNKGGGYRKWYGNTEYLINLKNNGEDIKNTISKSIYRLREPDTYFKNSICWPQTGADKFSSKFVSMNTLVDRGSCAIYFENNVEYKLLAILNSIVIEKIANILNPTNNFTISSISNIPIIDTNINNNIDYMVLQNIKLAKMDWDSFETSWDFKLHPLLKIKSDENEQKMKLIFDLWEIQCAKAFKQLKANEEDINRIFIEIYDLKDELSKVVNDKDICIRKADRERDIRSFISYAVGCMFGRYSIDAEGLIYAGGDFSYKWKVEDDKWQVRKAEKDEEGNVISDSWVDATFIPDVDNIIPITEDEYFEDDIVSRFIEFVKVVYGAETLEENLDFIAESLGVKANETSRQTIRRYFLKEFYKDHLKVYQKRPIYWMFDSGKNDGFKALVYMHRYNESTVAKLRTDYLHSLQRKYEAEILRLQTVSESTTLSAREKTQAKKNIDKINKKIEECKLYDQVVAHVANERISIDLDDGVKHNYGLFQGIKVPIDSGKEVKMNLLAKI